MAKGEATTKPSKASARPSERSKAKSEGVGLATTVEIAPEPEGHLTLKQRLFVEAYIGKARGNATEAARLAGYDGDDNTLRSVASENLTKDNISTEITKRVNELAKRMGADEIVNTFIEESSASYEDFIDINPDGSFSFNLLKAQKADKLHLIEELRHDAETGAPVVKLPNRQAARMAIAKLKGLLGKEQPSSQTNTQINIYENLNKLSTEDLRKIREAKQLTEGGKD